MTKGIDPRHFQDLAEMDPRDVCARSLCEYDGDSGGYTVSIWGSDYGVYPEQSRIIRLENQAELNDAYLGLFIVHYLLTSESRPLGGVWISVKDIPGGAAFFRGPHAIPAHLIENRYRGDLAAFAAACGQLGGTPMDMADRACSFRVAPRIPVAALLWDGDDEFPVEANLLFDKSIGDHLALDIIFALAVTVCKRLASIETA